MRKIKVTPFLVLLVPALVISIALTVYYLFINSQSPDAMTGILAFIFAFFISIILLAERLLVKYARFSFETLCKGQTMIIFLMIVAYLVAVATI
jgi:hypothetical protein